MFRVVARDFFGSPDTTDVLPPNIVKATYSDSLRTTLTLEFQNTAEIVWPADTLIAGMEDYFYLDGMSGQVVAGAASGNRVTLMLSSSGRARTVTYLPDRYYTNTNQVYEGPFITNLRGIGGLSFDEFPIDSDVVIAGLPSPNNTVSPSFYLYQNYPNPFNPTTTIIYRVTARSLVNLMVFDLLGRQVATLVNETKDRGEYQATWDATTFAGGVYFYHLWADGQSQSKKLVLLK